MVNWMDFSFGQLMHCARRSQQIWLAVTKAWTKSRPPGRAIATQALKAIGNLQCRDIRNLASSTATGSVSSSCNPSTSGSSAIAAELERRFPIFNAGGGRTNSRKRSSSASNHETSSLDRSHQNLGDL